MARGAPAVDARVIPDSSLEVFVAKQLLDGFEASGLGVE